MHDKSKTAVVVDQEAKERAYELGFNEFSGMETPENDRLELEFFTDSARYANIVAPKLRAIAGHADSGTGTFTTNRDIILVDERDLEDRPIEGDSWNARDYYSDVIHDAWRQGCHDGFHDDEKHTSLIV
jgi:hypothetical protein